VERYVCAFSRRLTRCKGHSIGFYTHSVTCWGVEQSRGQSVDRPLHESELGSSGRDAVLYTNYYVLFCHNRCRSDDSHMAVRGSELLLDRLPGRRPLASSHAAGIYSADLSLAEWRIKISGTIYRVFSRDIYGHFKRCPRHRYRQARQ
jgi:hypothetical protein